MMCEKIEEKIANLNDNSEYLINLDLNKAIEIMTKKEYLFNSIKPYKNKIKNIFINNNCFKTNY